MKRQLISLLAMLVCTVAAAQQREYMLIEKTDGSVVRLNVKDINRFFFEQKPVEIAPGVGGAVAEAVDLGLSVKWASWNVGASSTDDIGKTFCVGDVTGEMTEEESAALTLPDNICDTDYDIAACNWGNGWRLPNVSEWNELFEKCEITLLEELTIPEDPCNFKYTLKVTGPNGNYILFPHFTNDCYDTGAGNTAGYIDLNPNGYFCYMKGNMEYGIRLDSHFRYFQPSWYDQENVEFYYEGTYFDDFPYLVNMYVRPVQGEASRELVSISTPSCSTTNVPTPTINCSAVFKGWGFATTNEFGFCYSSTSQTPTLDNDMHIVGGSATITNLEPSTTYYIRAYATLDGETYYSDEAATVTTPVALPVFDDISQDELVDMGLSVKWASKDLGASSPSESGTAYEWASRDADGYLPEMICATELDPARTSLGGEWRMPTYDECKELADNCTWTQGYYNGVLGYKVSSKTTGNSIFLLKDKAYWSGTVADTVSAYHLGASGYVTSSYATNEYNVRPVVGDMLINVSVWGNTYYESGLLYNYGIGHRTAYFIVNPHGLEKAKESRRVGICYSTSENVTFENSLFAEADIARSGVVGNVRISGLQPGTRYYYRPVAVVDGVAYYDTEGTFTTEALEGAVADAVDLGLSVKWASWNVGASKADDYGSFFMYIYSLRNSRGNEVMDNYPLYEECLKRFESGMYNDIGGTDEDVATAMWGDGWRMPTEAECQELIDKCTWTVEYKGDIRGATITGPNGNSIFLPFTGGNFIDFNYGYGTWAYYWSSTFDPNSGPPTYWCLHPDCSVGFTQEMQSCGWNTMCTIRAVRK